MNTLAPLRHVDVKAAIDAAANTVAPTWPLDRFIAVNPLWGLIDRPLPEVAARLSDLAGARLTMPRAWYREALASGRLGVEDVQAALDEAGDATSVQAWLAALASDPPSRRVRARVVDVVDGTRDLVHAMSWRAFVLHHTSQFCASWFDEGQASLMPVRGPRLFADWRGAAVHDHGPALLMGFADFSERVRALAATPEDAIAQALSALRVPLAHAQDYLTSLLLDIQGWASWCAYRRWTARQEGGDDDQIVDLLAVRVSWELMLHDAGGPALARRWAAEVARWSADEGTTHPDDDLWVFQRAVELAYQRPLARELLAGLQAPPTQTPDVQAVFCIDVRSEVFRRALEGVGPSVQTRGFAGFFGLPIAWQPAGATQARPQLPGLVAPRLLARDGLDLKVGAARTQQMERHGAWKRFKHGALSGFSFVETTGLFFAPKLLTDALGLSRPVERPDQVGLTAAACAAQAPQVVSHLDGTPVSVAERSSLAAGILRGLGLTRDHARLVALVGHGSQTVNNPHAAGLDCGACCGQSGEVNARAAAALLNDPEVRAALRSEGIEVPSTTWFVAALHDTTTDEVTVFDAARVPESHRKDVVQFSALLARAGQVARAERAPRLGLGQLTAPALHRAVKARARDWAQVRPEWGLANNAAFVVGPRAHSRHANLAGRSFLHDYVWQEDEGFAVLEQILTAPMVVTHWINFQYYASTVDNERYGSGDKVLHNVVGGRLGVFEGNGGDLRTGLARQSLHDGKTWVHEPLRLAVFVEAPREAIAGILERHAHVRQLVENGWVFLHQLEGADRTAHLWTRDGWAPVGAC